MRTVPRSTPSARPGAPRRGAGTRGYFAHVAAWSRTICSASSMAAAFGPPPTTASAPLPTPPPERLGGRTRDRVGRHAPLDEILAHRDRDAGLHTVGTGSGERDDAGTQRAHRLLREPAQLVVGQAVARAAITAPPLAWAARSAAAERASLALSRCSSSCSVRTCSESRSIFSGISFGDARSSDARVPEQRFFLLDVLERAVAGDRLDPAQVRADRALAHDLDRADEAERAHVRAAAQLRGRPRLEHAHDLAVLLAEERDRAHALGLGLRRLVVAHGRVGDHLLVGQALDLARAARA